MKKKKVLKKVLLVLLIAFVVMQFIRIDKTNPAVVAENDFITITEPSDEIKTMLHNACYDCHSNETKYPWYSNVAPVSWWLKHHVDEGREHLNFSEWGTYSLKRQNHKLHECAEEVEEGEMPMSSYTIAHGEASLSADQKEKLAEWFESKMTQGEEEEEESDED